MSKFEKIESGALTIAQEKALAALMAGATIVDAAGAAGVSRRTLHGWLAEDASFIAARNAAQEELYFAFRARLGELAETAIATTAQAIDRGDVKASIQVLRGLGLLNGRFEISGPTNAATIKLELENQAHELHMREALHLPWP